jgi:hypothetical protein
MPPNSSAASGAARTFKAFWPGQPPEVRSGPPPGLATAGQRAAREPLAPGTQWRSVVTHDVGQEPHETGPQDGPSDGSLEFCTVPRAAAGQQMPVARDHDLQRAKVFVVDVDGARAPLLGAESTLEGALLPGRFPLAWPFRFWLASRKRHDRRGYSVTDDGCEFWSGVSAFWQRNSLSARGAEASSVPALARSVQRVTHAVNSFPWLSHFGLSQSSGGGPFAPDFCPTQQRPFEKPACPS